LRINVLIGTTLIGLLDGVFHHIFESQGKGYNPSFLAFEELSPEHSQTG